MRARPPVLIGIGLGAAAALLVISHTQSRAAEPREMLADAGGPIRAVVMQYSPGAAYVGPVFRDYLKWQTPELTVYLACPDEAAFAEFTALVSPASPKCKIIPVYTHHPMTAWSRDRWVAMIGTSPAKSPTTLLLSPAGELAQDVWPDRAGDSHMGEDLARECPAIFSARRSNLYFDGGDLLADGGNVFVTPAVIDRNVQHTVATREELSQTLSRELSCRAILMPDAPDHHAGMYMMSAGAGADGRRIMVVADPSLGRGVYAESAESDAFFTGGPDFSEETQGHFDSVAKLAANAGYRVVRIPVVPGHGKMYMTYVNVILDRVGARPVVYMSSYQGQEGMNAAAAKVWERLGYEVRPVDCTTVWRLGGTVHCLVNVFLREG